MKGIPSSPDELAKLIEEYDKKAIEKKVRAKEYREKRKQIVPNPKFKKYNITPEDYDELYTKQNGRCAICNKTKEETLTPICIDHSHKTGKVRGLLCYSCNQGIGFFKDDIQLLQKAINYLINTNNL